MADEDPRLVRARNAGLNTDGINLDPDAGQAQVQEIADRVEALGYIPSDGANLAYDPITGEENPSVEELEEGQRQANRQYTMPPDGLAAEKPIPPHSAEATSSEEDEEDDEEDSEAPAKSASRSEWDAYAEEQGVDPSQYGTKEELQAALGY